MELKNTSVMTCIEKKMLDKMLFGSKCQAMKCQMTMLRLMSELCGCKKNKIQNECIWEKVRVETAEVKIVEPCLSWFGYLEEDQQKLQ